MSERDSDPCKAASARFDLSSHLVPVAVGGRDAGRFLQAQLSCDVERLGPEHAAFGAYLSPQGRVLATLVVVPDGERFLVLLHPTLVEATVGRLRRYVLRDDVILEPVPLAVSGGGSAIELERPPDLSRIPLQSEDGGRTLALPDQRSLHVGTVAGTEPADGWCRADLQQGIAWIEAATSDRHIAQALGLDRIGAVSFSKGCYPGQEIVARVHYLGRAKRSLSLLRGARAPHAAEELHDASGTRAGEVVSAARAEEDFLVLAVMTGEPIDVVDAEGAPLALVSRFE